MNKTWTFIGGLLAGVASVFATAAVAVSLEENSFSSERVEEERLALPEGSAEKGTE